MGGKVLSLTLILFLVMSGSAAWAQQRAEGQMAPGAGAGDTPWEVAAAGTNVFYVPGKAIICVGGAAAGIAWLIMTLGNQYELAGKIWHEGCSGKWVVTAADVKPKAPADEEFWMERPEFRR
jgi:hypothetical protein